MASKRIFDTVWFLSDRKNERSPGRDTRQPIFISRHLQHAARTLKPGGSGCMHTAFNDFKQAYDTIPGQDLRQHLHRTRMPSSFLSIIQDMTLMNTF